MIKSLHRKFIVIAMGSLFLILVLIIGTINALNWYQITRRTDNALKIISDNGGDLPPWDESPPPQKFSLAMEFQLTPETPFETRYFTADISASGTVTGVNTSHIAAVNEALARQYAAQIAATGKNGGYFGEYRFLLSQNSGAGGLLVVIDCRMTIQAFRSFLYVSCVVAVLSLILMFALTTILSKKALRPVAESIEKQKRFVTDAGHELKTPLAIIQSSADVLTLENGENEWTSSIQNQIQRMDSLLKNLLTLAKLDEFEEQACTFICLSHAVQEETGLFSATAAAKNKQIEALLEEDITIFANLQEIRQVLAILLDNSITYSAENSVIKASLYSSGKKAVFVISNSVSALPGAQPEHLFDRFFRDDPSRARESGGYGVGLSIAKAIVEKHHGEITAAYGKNNIVSFKVSLPRAKQAAE